MEKIVWRRPRTGYITIMGGILVLLNLIINSLSDKVVFIFVGTFFFFIIVTIFSSRWVLSDSYFGHKNVFWQTFYPLESINKIYLAKLPTDNSLLAQSEKMGELAAAAIATKDPKASYLGSEDVAKLATQFAPLQLWLDLHQEDNTIKSFTLASFEVNRNTYLSNLPKIIEQMFSKYPHIVDSGVVEFFRKK